MGVFEQGTTLCTIYREVTAQRRLALVGKSEVKPKAASHSIVV